MSELDDMSDPRTWVDKWIRRYPDPKASDDKNTCARAEENAWLAEFGAGDCLTQQQVVDLVRWKFQWYAPRKRALEGIQGIAWDHASRCITQALEAASNSPGKDLLLQYLLGARGGISGCGPAMSSVILAVRFPERFTIADSFALESLRLLGRTGQGKNPEDAAFYEEDWEEYLKVCRDLAESSGRSLREVD